MNNQEMLTVESRRGFLKKSAYMAPAIMMLGSLKSHASSSDDSNSYTSQGGASTLSCNTSSYGLDTNQSYKDELNNVGVDTYGGHEKDLEGSSSAPTETLNKS